MISTFLIQLCCCPARSSTSIWTIIGLISGFILAGTAILQFRQNLKIKRAEILTHLFEKFYVTNDFKEIREWLDSSHGKIPDEKSFEAARDQDKNFDAKFSDYLNYFQFLVSLRNMGQLKDEEISSMFNYYLVNLKQSLFVMKYLSKFGYKALHDYLQHYKNAE